MERNGFTFEPVLPEGPRMTFMTDKYPIGTRMRVTKGDQEWLFANDVQARKFISSDGTLPTREVNGVLWLPEVAFAS